MQIRINGIPADARPGESLREIVVRLGLDTESLKTRPIAADIAGEVFTLNYIPMRQREQGDNPTTFRMRKAIRKGGGEVKLIRYGESRGRAIYERTIIYIFFLAMRELFPKAHAKVNYAVGPSLDISVDVEPQFTPDDMEAIRAKMRGIVEADYPLIRKRLDIDEAIERFEKDGQEDKVRLLKWRQFTYFDVYEHGDYADYFYGEMLPSTGYAKVFDLQFRPGGLFLLRPSDADADVATRYVYMPNLSKVFARSDKWGDLMHCRCVADLNDMVENGSVRELIRVNEALHERRFAEIATEIVNRGARAVLIAGPSSSGKTTSANRVATQLRVLGKTPILLSLDDYYIDRSLIEPDENGEIDYEHINMIDVPQFNIDLEALLNGERVEIPHFDFKTGSRQMLGHFVQLKEDAMLIIEGLHGLNPQLLTSRIDKKQIFKLYVSALTTLNLDDHNRIPTTDVRLLRRMVRDYLTRGATIERTLGMWDSVKRGEQRWIFPYQESADEIMNTSLVYELAVLKKHIYPLLNDVDSSSPNYDEVINIIKFLNYISDAAVEDEIPPTSILREFVGGNTFYR
ncbi:MAG: nucleoside kinase [Clostridia bacterium]|nr:nucleoside kinase [Clostridia bacterium]